MLKNRTAKKVLNLNMNYTGQYIKYYLVALIMAVVLRLIETIHVFIKFNPKYLIISELFGIFRDVFAIGLVMPR